MADDDLKQRGNGWGEWGKHVLHELERNHEDHAELFRLVRKMEIELVKLQVKAGFIGAIAGAILSGIVAVVVSALKSGG